MKTFWCANSKYKLFSKYDFQVIGFIIARKVLVNMTKRNLDNFMNYWIENNIEFIKKKCTK